MSELFWPLAARAELTEAVTARLRAERGAGVVLSGEPGIGKTTLLQQVFPESTGPAMSVRGSALTAEVPFGALHPHLTSLPDDDAGSPLAVTRALGRALAGRDDGSRPVVLVDNSALVDQHSAHVLAGLAESGAAVLAVTAVDVVDMPQAFVELWRDDLLPSLSVPPLTEDEIADLVTGYLGGPVAAGTLRHLTDTSEGNPQMLRYLVEDAVGSGGLAPHDGVWSLTAGPSAPGTRLAQLVGTRLARWSAAEREGLEIIALTERIPLGVLLKLVDAEALERLERSGVVVVDGDPEPAAGIGSRLVADVVRRGVPFTRRRALREQVLAAGADLTEGPPRRLLSYALWTLDSGAELEPAVAVRAARAADHLGDPELALRLATPVGEGPHLGPAAVVRVRSLRRIGLAAHAAQVAEAVLDAPLEGSARAALATEQAASLTWVDGGVPRGLAALADARRRLDEQGTELGGDPGSEPGGDALAASLGLPELALRYAGGATDEIVEPLGLLHGGGGSRGLLASALLAAALANSGRQADAAGPLADATAALVEPGMDAEVRLCALLTAVAAAEHCGRRADALNLLARGLVGAGPEALVIGGAVETAQGLLHALAGRVADGRRHLLSALSQARRRDAFRTAGPALAGLALCAARTGDAGVARAYLGEHRAQEYTPEPGAALARRCLLTARTLLGDDVTAELLAVAAADLDGGRRMDAVLLLSTAARQGSRDAAERLLQVPLAQPGPLADALAGHAAAVLAADADGLLRAAGSLVELGDPAAAAEVAGAVTALPGVDRDGVRAAQRLLTTARRAMGGSRPAAARTGAEGLTPREQDVASRAAARLSNQEIARELHLSVRTVESYLQSAFGKLGVNSRSELREVLATAS